MKTSELQKLKDSLLSKINDVFAKIDPKLKSGKSAPAEEEEEESSEEEEAEGGDEEEASEEEAEEAEESEEEEASEEEGETLTEEEVEGMSLKELKAKAKELGITPKKSDEETLRSLLISTAKFGAGEDLEPADAKALALACGLVPGKKLAQTIEELTNFFTGGEEEEAEEAEESEEEEASEEEAEETEEAEEEEASEEEESEEEASEEEEAEEEAEEEEAEEADPVAEFKKFPADADIKKRIAAYNTIAKKKIVVGKNLKASYRELLKFLVDDDQKIALWGKPYIRNEEAFCCGHPTKEVTIKGHEQAGRCQITKVVWSFDADNNKFVEVKTAKK
jgi:hypothetical protein